MNPSIPIRSSSPFGLVVAHREPLTENGERFLQ
jgi:hypothetical protein